MDRVIEIAVVGSDARLYYCTEHLRAKGIKAVQFSDNAIPSGVRYYLFAPPAPFRKLSDVTFAKNGATVFAGAVDEDSETLITSQGGIVIDYCKTDCYAYENSALTAEAAIMVYVGASSISLRGAKTLVSGFGRIGKALSALLKAHGADVTASARKLQDIELIRAYGCKPMETAAIRGEYDVVFNTVPANVYTRDIIDRTKTDYYVELASAPFGIENRGIWGNGTKVITASGLPGKVLPVSAGKLIADTVCTIMEEARI